MRIPVVVAAVASAGVCAWTDEPQQERSVTVCVRAGSNGLARGTAQPEVTRIFREIGIRIDWARDPQTCLAGEGIIVSFSEETPVNDHPGAWGYALPYEGTHIVVFSDRVQKSIRETGEQHLLTYVIAHELAHMLEGVTQHSETGILKARWDRTDFFNMDRRALCFAPEDIALMQQSLGLRMVRIAGNAAGKASAPLR